MSYQCQQCGRVWDDQTAVENEFLCTRRCGGECVEQGAEADRQVDPLPIKLYIELTTDCDMDCPMCIRHSWDQPAGAMSDETFDAILAQLADMPSIRTVNFSGFGEPMTHPKFFEFAARAKQAGLTVEAITNGMSLDSDAIDKLIDLPLDRLIVSIDSLADPSGELLHSGSFATVSKSLRMLYHRRQLRKSSCPDVNIEFVATRKNIHELPQLRQQALVLGFSRILVTNVIPQTPELADDVLYGSCNMVQRGQEVSPWQPCLDMPVTDTRDDVNEALKRLVGTGVLLRVNGADISGAGPHCRFIAEGRLAIRSDGALSPCLALMHSHRYYFRKRSRRIRAYRLGNVNETAIKDIWESNEYRDFRDRVRKFEFSPCLDCGGCNLRDSNEIDCSDNIFPRCGECLWAAGWIQCP
ncbi:MAG: SPASM domain-containing protein [Phycisphaerae bacterium]|jgi:MoaA/NifB/PqqE/SkfB family radical SAM enzyme|nr:SPASM domain-containing protein [Phycisphaerae bacterium]